MTLDERIQRYLDKCAPAVSGQDGHGTALSVAVALVWGFGLEPEAAYPYFERYNVRCAPPWKPKEIRHKLSEAAKVDHKKLRGHLLGGVNGNSRGPQSTRVPRVAPVRLKPEKVQKERLRTVRTVFSEPCTYKGKEDHHVPHVLRTSEQPSEPSESLFGLIPVPGCQIGRPPEIEMADADWLAAERSGLLSEPVVQAALWMFGPGCTVLATGKDVS